MQQNIFFFVRSKHVLHFMFGLVNSASISSKDDDDEHDDEEHEHVSDDGRRDCDGDGGGDDGVDEWI